MGFTIRISPQLSNFKSSKQSLIQIARKQITKPTAGMSPQIAWIGLGNMGRGMCSNLVSKGALAHPVIIYNRTKSRATDHARTFGAEKCIVVDSIEDAVSKSDIIFTCVGDDGALTQTMEAATKGTVTGKLFVDCSTVHPETTNKIAELVHGNRAAFVACPVFGSPAMAASGALICVLAGPTEHVERVKPFATGVMGRAVLDLSGETPAKASLLKIIGNTFVTQMVEALGEGYVLAEKTGLGVDKLHSFVEVMFPGPYTAYGSRLMSGDYYNRAEPLFAVDLALKDSYHALDLARKSGTKLRAAEVGKAHLEDVKREKGAKGDIAGIYGAVRLESGLKFDN